MAPLTGQVKYNTKRMPKCTRAEQYTISEFLRWIAECTELSLNNHRVLAMTDKSPRILRMVGSYRDRLAIIRFLQNLNDQRKLVKPTENARLERSSRRLIDDTAD